MTTLRIKDVFKRYPNGAEAVKGVSVDVEDGELVVFVGPSGCGKSTMLRMVAGLESVTEGEIELAGRVVNDLEPAERNIAMVFQNYALYPHMSVRKNLAYGLKNRGTPQAEIDRKVDEAAKLLQIGEFLDRKPSQLSGGQRQRVAMGRAIVRDPAIFLFDEPLSNLDAKLRNQMRLEIKKLQRSLGTAAIYVTHDQVEAMTLADRIVVLNNGLIEQVGKPHEVYSQPASTFVASFIGAPPMNLLDATLSDGRIEIGGQSFAVQQTQKAGPIKLGLRPERLQVASGGEGFRVEVGVLEDLGATRLIHARLGDQDLTIAQDSELPEPSSEALITFRHDDAHFFDASSGRRI
ncbi:sn-glycerol-3-phosphate ABC transporter ATP-binding protein UgpC [Alphaproteobacteria bacterium GH1-50]|uniref:sn-glycerol-3-phosphate ABC transporter ATP-binding protein UgpC n=1 Tax=Kangsaoukella pontilimi TaxID=2691042 RepID=A0A7C9MPG6_9RHOB|nr:sn-glycerol-3-phosphate ABC transporter ATP-binding protein UgpC [Kangsaoukella pontilimi]MXQ06457.1 sn-glycerol-3-phosphate ABC transporter ATP-binding protein UgpC [Kangsaoukella pontilimi]